MTTTTETPKDIVSVVSPTCYETGSMVGNGSQTPQVGIYALIKASLHACTIYTIITVESSARLKVRL